MICRECTKVVFVTSNLDNSPKYEHSFPTDTPHEARPMTSVEEFAWRTTVGQL